jgi:hypothetical protein
VGWPWCCRAGAGLRYEIRLQPPVVAQMDELFAIDAEARRHAFHYVPRRPAKVGNVAPKGYLQAVYLAWVTCKTTARVR